MFKQKVVLQLRLRKLQKMQQATKINNVIYAQKIIEIALDCIKGINKKNNCFRIQSQ